MNYFVLENACQEQIKQANGDMLAYLRDLPKEERDKEIARMKERRLAMKNAAALTARQVAIGVGAATLAGGGYAAMRKDGPVRKALDGAGVRAFKKRWGKKKR